jgi:hypothetical protein
MHYTHCRVWDFSDCILILTIIVLLLRCTMLPFGFALAYGGEEGDIFSSSLRMPDIQCWCLNTIIINCMGFLFCRQFYTTTTNSPSMSRIYWCRRKRDRTPKSVSWLIVIFAMSFETWLNASTPTGMMITPPIDIQYHHSKWIMWTSITKNCELGGKKHCNIPTSMHWIRYSRR